VFANSIFDNSGMGTAMSSRGIGDSPLAAITVSGPITINQIGAMVNLSTNANMKFLIFNMDTNALLFSTAATPEVNDGLMDFKVSAVFPTFTLMPGVHYAIGAIADQSAMWEIANGTTGFPFSMNGVTATGGLNANVANFTTPNIVSTAAAMVIIKLWSPDFVDTPEPVTAGLTAASLALLLMMRRRRAAR
jgi:MYXO-CTERM domain-containing protein